MLIAVIHDDLTKWKHFPCYWFFVRGIHWSPVDAPHNGQWCRAVMFSLICTWTNSWANNRDASDLRRHSAHYDVTVMIIYEGQMQPRDFNSGNGSVPSGIKSLPEQMLTQIYAARWHHKRLGANALTHWPLGDLNEIWNFQANFNDWWLRYLLQNCPQMNVTGPYWWQVIIGSGNGLVPTGNKPLPEPMLTQIFVAIWHH